MEAKTLPRILLVDDSEGFRDSLARAFSHEFEVKGVDSASEALKLLQWAPDLVLLDLRLDEADFDNRQGIELLNTFRAELPDTPVIMITAYGDVETAVECMRLGAADFIQKGGAIRELRARIHKALDNSRARRRLRQLEDEIRIVEPREIVGNSEAIREVKRAVAAYAEHGNVTVLITGETGTGKELVARSIHASGPRAEGPFVAVTLSALPATTIEAELFGHEPGAFTDARARRIGYIERARGGVLFLDEIGELAPQIQVKLLRFLEEHVINRLGGRDEIPVDVQVIAATNADMTALLREGKLRDDLYYRLKVCHIHIPPLRERRTDIPAIVEHYFSRLGGPARGIEAVSDAALRALTEYDWPGNVRELRNAMEAGILKASLRHHRFVERGDLPVEVLRGGARRQPSADEASLEEAVARAELDRIVGALRACGGKKTEAWKLLGLNDRFSLTRRLNRLRERFPDLVDLYPELRARSKQT